MNELLDRLFKEEHERSMTTEGLAAESEARSDIMAELMAADPQLSVIGALVMAGDRLGRYRSQRFVEAGVPAVEVGVYVGSYERLAFWRWAYEQGHIDRDFLLKMVFEDWSSSDPDDTDPFWVECWAEIAKRNGGPVYDRPAPVMRPDRIIKVYRGQPEGAVPGIAWSMDQKVARKFAVTGGARATTRTDGVVFEANIYVRDCYAFLWGRSEQEVVLNPARLMVYEGMER